MSEFKLQNIVKPEDICNLNEIKTEPMEFSIEVPMIDAVKNASYLNECGKALPLSVEDENYKSEADDLKMIKLEDEIECEEEKILNLNYQLHDELSEENYMQQITNKRKPTCKICGKIFATTNLFIFYKHIKKCSAYKCRQCKKVYSKKSLVLECLRTHLNTTLYNCKICDAEFTGDDLMRHMSSHQADSSSLAGYECDLCGRMFKSDLSVATHKAKCVRKSYKCKVCSKTFVNRMLLIKHKAEHAGEEPRKCYVCNKIFLEKNVLKTHMLVHSVVKHLECKVCNKKFGRSCQLRSHERTHRFYECPVCFRRFKYKARMTQHYNGHKTSDAARVEVFDGAEKFVCNKNDVVDVNCDDSQGIYIKPELEEVECEEETINM